MYEVFVKMKFTDKLINEIFDEENVTSIDRLSEILCSRFMSNKGVESCEVEIKDLRFKDETRN